jgi:hypothetical protein
MACQIRNIADFSGGLHRGRPAGRGRARIYQFPSRPACPDVPCETARPSPELPGDSPWRRRMFLGIEAAGGLLFYGMWLLWHFHH